MDRTKRYFLTTKYNTSTPLILKKFISISLFVIFPLKISFRTFPPPFPFLLHPAFALSLSLSLSAASAAVVFCFLSRILVRYIFRRLLSPRCRQLRLLLAVFPCSFWLPICQPVASRALPLRLVRSLFSRCTGRSVEATESSLPIHAVHVSRVNGTCTVRHLPRRETGDRDAY